MMRRRMDQQGFALIAVLAILAVLTVLGSLLLRIVNKEVRLGALRKLGAESLYLAEAGGYAARAGLMVLVDEGPTGQVSIVPTLTSTQVADWYAGGTASAQNPLALFDYLVLDGAQYSFTPTSSAASLAFEVVDWSVRDPERPHRKLQAATGNPPDNPLGPGQFRATLVVSKRLAPHPADPEGQPWRYIQQLGPDYYEFYYTYAITSDGEVAPQSRRRVTLSGDFSVRVGRQSFALYALFTHVHTMPSGGAIWFTSRTSFDGPVHTNGEFRFAFFPKFTDVVTSAGCADADCSNLSIGPDLNGNGVPDSREYARFNNNGSNVRLQANANATGDGVRIDAPLKPDGTPGTNQDNGPAAFTRGVDPITVPENSYNQRAIAIGRNPTDTTPNGWCSPDPWWSCSGSGQWNQAIRQVVPELANNSNSVPDAVYVPVIDANRNGISDAGEALAGGIYVDGDLSSLTLSCASAPGSPQPCGQPGANLAVYTFVRGSPARTVTVTVDRENQRTTVNNTCWNPEGSPACSQSGTRTFQGVPKGWQGTPGSENSTVIYVQGNLAGSALTQGLKGTLEEKEQVMLVTSGRIDIVDNVQYEDPPDVTDPLDNPLNVLGLFSASNDIQITTAAPSNLVLHAALMAGAPGVPDGYNSSVFVQNYNSRPPSGAVQMIGSLVEEYYGAFGTFNVNTGNPETGYGRDFKFDRRLARGIEPPYFPTTTLFEVRNVDNQKIAGVRPVWREAAP